MHTVLKKCGNHDAHMRLMDLEQGRDSWQNTRDNKDRAPDISQLLMYFKTRGQCPNKDSKCKRFFLLVERVLSRTRNEFRVSYDNFWDTWGCIAGEVLKKEDPDEAEVEVDDAKIILHNLRHDFSDNKLNHRQLAVKGFKTLLSKSAGYVDVTLEVFNYFRAYGEAACSGILGELPGQLCMYISWLTESHCEIAEELSRGEIGSGCTSSFASDIINSAGVIIELITRADGSVYFDREEELPYWRKAMFEWMFPQAKIRQDINFQVMTTKDVRETMKALIEKLDYLQKVPDYRKMSDILDNLRKECEEIYQRIVVK
jgi:hypothetical protein